MIAFIKHLFINKESKEQKNNDFSDFFLNAKSKEKAKVIRQVLREANEEQRELVGKYKQKFSVGIFEFTGMDIK